MNIKKSTQLPPGITVNRLPAGPKPDSSPFWRKTGWGQKNAEKRLKNEDRAREICARQPHFDEDDEE